MDYYIMIGKEKVPVSEAVYKTWCRGERKERYFREGDIGNGVFSYDALDTEELNGCELFSGPAEFSAELMAEKNLMKEQLYRALRVLTAEERELVDWIYVQEKSLREAARQKGIPLTTLQYRHKRLLKKLKYYFEHTFDLPDESYSAMKKKPEEKREIP